MIYLTRRERFTAAHKLYREDWSPKKNMEIFGGCANPNWHGHNYEVFITIKGEIDPQFGYLMNLKDLSKLICENVIDKVDHKNLNIDVDFMKGIMTSTENVAVAIWKQLESPLKKHNVQLHSVKLIETENNSVEYFGG
ncbi:MAG: 6-carboxytetrahydropterin synthase [Bacteroidetes bacterium]|nr:6-carboxytetrahydropterin synthase [Bacteroidota bacterium]